MTEVNKATERSIDIGLLLDYCRCRVCSEGRPARWGRRKRHILPNPNASHDFHPHFSSINLAFHEVLGGSRPPRERSEERAGRLRKRISAAQSESNGNTSLIFTSSEHGNCCFGVDLFDYFPLFILFFISSSLVLNSYFKIGIYFPFLHYLNHETRCHSEAAIEIN